MVMDTMQTCFHNNFTVSPNNPFVVVVKPNEKGKKSVMFIMISFTVTHDMHLTANLLQYFGRWVGSFVLYISFIQEQLCRCAVYTFSVVLVWFTCSALYNRKGVGALLLSNGFSFSFEWKLFSLHLLFFSFILVYSKYLLLPIQCYVKILFVSSFQAEECHTQKKNNNNNINAKGKQFYSWLSAIIDKSVAQTKGKRK